MNNGGRSGGLTLERDHALDDAHHIGFLHDDEVLAVDLHLRAGPFPEQDAIAGLHVERHELAALIASTGPGGDDLPFLRLLLGGIRNDDATLRLLFGVDAADHDAVVQGAKFHGSSSGTLLCPPQYMPSWHSYCKSATINRTGAARDPLAAASRDRRPRTLQRALHPHDPLARIPLAQGGAGHHRGAAPAGNRDDGPSRSAPVMECTARGARCLTISA